ncbi:MAG: hypothetical protein HQ503_01395 [Rhodospirillales bacterium]|nr:hypothetical protein [Rhodospirillales bacterium]
MSDEKSAAKADTAKSAKETTTSDSSKSKSKSSDSGKSASAVSISHFSSVRTDEYRAGWHNVFGNGKSTPSKKSAAAKAAAKRGPIAVELRAEDLSVALRAGLEDALRRKAKKDNIKLGRISNSRPIIWRITGELSG